jgi:hypothetical protein
VNPEFTLSLRGPCGKTVEGLAGSDYDDGIGGEPDFERWRPGHTWDVVLTIGDHDAPMATQNWQFGLGVEGAVTITDITTEGTVACLLGDGPMCRLGASGGVLNELTGPPDGEGPQTEQNRGALSVVFLSTEPTGFLVPGASYVVCKIRVFARFPETENGTASGRVFFATRTGSRDSFQSAPTVYFLFSIPITAEMGNPPLHLEDCEVQFRAVGPVAALKRCDPNADGRTDIADAVWILNELFRQGPATLCSPAADCNGDERRDVSDAVYGLAFQFTGGPAPPEPFRDCARVPGVQPEDCPLGSTSCI